MATIKDVAQYANVSTATVSRVMNGGSVTLRTKAKVLKAIEVLEYVPNAIARSLKTSSSHTIGVLVKDFCDNSCFAFLKQLEKCMSGYSFIICSSDNNTRQEVIKLDVLQTYNTDALLVFPTGEDTKHISKAIESGTPVIVFDATVDEFATDIVRTKGLIDTISFSNAVADVLKKRISGDFSDFPKLI